MNNFLNILGAVAAVISFIVWVPQAIFSGRVIECNDTQEVKGIPLLSSDILIEKRTT